MCNSYYTFKLIYPTKKGKYGASIIYRFEVDKDISKVMSVTEMIFPSDVESDVRYFRDFRHHWAKGKPVSAKTDEFLENFRTAFYPPPPPAPFLEKNIAIFSANSLPKLPFLMQKKLQ